MKKRSVVAVILLPFVTFGIYALYWFVKTKGDLNEKGATIPTAWLLIVPLVNIWWMWKYYEGAEQVTNKKVSGVLMFVLGLLVTSIIPMAICQDAYNKLSAVSPSMPMNPAEPVAPMAPQTIGTPVAPVASQPTAPLAEAPVAPGEVTTPPENPTQTV